MKYSDLHIHSYFSDGILSPEKIVDLAVKKNLGSISITDHDTINSQYIINSCANRIDIIPGIELSSRYYEHEMHILGYYIDIKNENLLESIDILKKSRLNRVKEIVFKLNCQGINLDIKDFDRYANSSLGRSHIANILVEKGYANNYKNAFTSYLIEGKDTYVERYKFEYKDTIDMIRKAGGVSVLSHPGKIGCGMNIEKLIKDFKFYGLQGIEVYHPSHTSKQINYFYNLAKKYKLLITGGSDCHGIKNSAEEVLLGTYGINEILINKIKTYHLKQRR